jgi:hypothetical protein
MVSEALWLILGASLALTIRLARLLGRRARLRSAFGENVHTGEDIAIYLPLWRAQDRSRAETRFEKQSGAGETRRYYGPDRSFAEEDVKSALETAQTFSKFFSRPIAIRPDDERLHENETTLLIGAAVANWHVDSILDLYRCHCPDRLPIEFPMIEENDDSRAVFFIKNNATGDEYRFTGATDYAFILRLPKVEDGEGYHFIIAGIDASGTQAAGSMLRRRWSMFAKSKGPAAAVITLQRGRPETCRVVTWIYRRNNRWATRAGPPAAR